MFDNNGIVDMPAQALRMQMLNLIKRNSSTWQGFLKAVPLRFWDLLFRSLSFAPASQIHAVRESKIRVQPDDVTQGRQLARPTSTKTSACGAHKTVASSIVLTRGRFMTPPHPTIVRHGLHVGRGRKLQEAE